MPPTAPASHRADHDQPNSSAASTDHVGRATSARVGPTVAAVVLPLRLFLAAGWLRAAIEKVIDARWWTGDVVEQFLVDQRAHMLPGFDVLADSLLDPWSQPVAWFVVGMQLAVGLCLLLGCHTVAALRAAVLLNVTFVLAGAVNPSAFYLVMELALLLAVIPPVRWPRSLGRAAVWSSIALALLPFATTMAPSEVIDDPALMLSFVCGLAAVGSIATGEWRRVPLLARLADRFSG